MKKLTRIVLLAFVVFGLASVADAPPAFAFFHHNHKHIAKTHHKHVKHVKRHSKTNTMVRDAQTSLINLAYLKGRADGVLGPKTKKAIKDFQGDHGLPVTGKLTKETYNAIIKADKSRAMASLPLPMTLTMPQHTMPLAQEGLVGNTNEDYADPMRGSKPVIIEGTGQPERTQQLTSRFTKIDVNETVNGTMRRYDLILNGTPILRIDDQPSVIGISETYTLGNEDAIILSTYNAGDSVCAYKHYLLTLAEGQFELRAFGDCTHGYQARKVEDSLFVTFPEVDDQRVAGATWRYENGDLEKL